jgi:hypothetical protein
MGGDACGGEEGKHHLRCTAAEHTVQYHSTEIDKNCDTNVTEGEMVFVWQFTVP